MTSATDDALDILAVDIANPLIWPLVPVSARDAVATLWALNRRLAMLARAPSEPLLRQIRLRWWTDELYRLDVTVVPPEPLLAQVAQQLLTTVTADQLGRLAEAWLDAITADEGPASSEYGRGLFTMTGALTGQETPQCGAAGAIWSSAEQAARDMADASKWPEILAALSGVRLAALPRPLAALVGQARCVARANGRRSVIREQFSILRIGLFGR